MNTVPVPQNARAGRAIVFAGIAVFLSALGHAASAGHGVSMSSLIVAFAATSSIAWALADRQRGFFAIGGGLAVMQAVLHVWFGMAAMSTAHGAATEPVLLQGDPGLMFAAHAAAALVCGVWLWRGEVVCFGLLAAVYTRILAPLFLVLVHPSVDDNPRILAEVDHRIEMLREGVLRHVMARRGPPAASGYF
ncbi:hypothetical protein [Nocardia amamiensis]|uniref:hypothetical protein n=1 Tax=Nocardia amamiensis TaxID=404578 RepID=UPI000B02CCEC|nr:hypothetical protein [Nocardia amamiensis]